ncbi:hypothetical protein [Archangium sp.]|uniref:hypothetical protein n=1 Tax=Archangium sp. TaxID=1872627 RepID=UPI00286C3D9C|nr:hypothetical protein [Archangium sp.]
MAERSTSLTRSVARRLQLLTWELGNGGEPQASLRMYPELPLWTAHHARFGILYALRAEELVEYARLAAEAAMSVAAAGWELHRYRLTSPFAGWAVRRGGETLLMVDRGDAEDLRRILDWVRRHRETRAGGGRLFSLWMAGALVYGPYLPCGCWSHGCEECGKELPGCCSTDLCDACLDGHDVAEVASA